MAKQIIKPQILDTDTNIQNVSNVCAMDIANLRVNNTKVQNPLNGTVQIDSPTPLINTTCIRSVEDEKTGTIFEFHAGDDNSYIVQYLPEIPERQMIMETQALNFQEEHPVLAAPIEERFLMFTDNINPPRYINWEKANRTNKRLKATILFGKPETGVNVIFQNGAEYTMTFNIPNVAPITTTILVCNGTYVDNLIQGAIEFKNAFNANANINTYFIATYCGCGEVTIEELAASGDKDGNITTCSISVTNAPNLQDPKCLVIYDNVYPQTITDFHINRARRTPQKQPTVQLIADASKKSNLIYNKNPQFAFRLFYTDKHYTTFSPISKLAITDTDCLGKQALAFNGVDIDFTDIFANPLAVDEGGILQKADYLQEIEAVEIAWRDGNSGIWQIAKRLNRCDFGLHRQWWTFYNGEISTSLPEIESPDSKPYDRVPLTMTADALGTIASGEGARSFPMNITEGYDPVCPDLRLNVDTTTLPKCGRKNRITVWGKIYCPYTSGGVFIDEQQCVWQMEDGTVGFGGMGTTALAGFVPELTGDYQQILPSKGFPAYLAGTEHIAISTQWVEGGHEGQYADVDFGVFLGDNSENRAAIRDTCQNKIVWQKWVFENVPNGRYVFRIASHWCSIGDTLGKGRMYDLSIGNLYQTTSSYVDSIIPYVSGAVPSGVVNNNALNAKFHWKEILLDIPFDDSTTEIAEWNFGKVNIADQTDPSAIDSTWVAQAYIFDSQGSSEPSDIRVSNRVEYCGYDSPVSGIAVSPMNYPSASIVDPPANYADHNGFVFGGNNQVSSYPNNNVPTLRIWGWDTAGNRSFIKTSSLSAYVGGLDNLENGTLSSTSIKMAERTGIGLRGNRLMEFICWTQNSDIRNSAATIGVTVADQNNVPQSGVLAVLSLVGRLGLTDSLGVFETLRYSKCPLGAVEVINTQYALGIGTGCCIDLENTNQVTDLDAGDTAYFSADVMIPNPIPFNVTVEYNEAFKALKKGSTIYVGIVYYDKANRCTAVETTKFSYYTVPFWSEGLLNYYLTWEIYSLPPSWANKYQLLVAMPPYSYVWFVADAVKYMVTFKNSLNKVETTFNSGVATEIHISTNSISLFNEQNKNSSVQYTFTEGDRLRLIFDNSNTLITDFIDVPILGYENGYVVIEYSSDLPEIKTGFVCEIYNQATIVADSLIFNEAGMCYPIIDDGGILYHGKGEDSAVISFIAQDQTSTLPATGYLDFSNTYQHTRTMNTNQDDDLGWRQFTPLVEAMNVSDFFSSQSLDIGRPNAINPNSKQVKYQTMIAYCNAYLPNKNLNGLCQFELLSRQTFDTTLGAIQCGAAIQGVLIVIGTTGSMSVYLGQSQMVAQNVSSVIALNDAILGGWRSFADNFSTRHPLSFVAYRNEAFWFDANNKTIVKYTTGGCYSINRNAGGFGGVEKTMRDISELLPFNAPYGLKDALVFAAVDKFYKEYVIRFPSDNEQGFITYTYDLLNNVWRGRYDLGGIAMAGTQAGLVSFVESQLWEHDKDPLNVNVFYGNDRSALVQLALNDDVENVKTFESIAFLCTFDTIISGIFHAPTNGDIFGKHPLGTRDRKSFINETHFVQQQGTQVSSFRRDTASVNAPLPLYANGEKMITRWLSAKFICNNRRQFALDSIIYLYNISPKSNTQ